MHRARANTRRRIYISERRRRMIRLFDRATSPVDVQRFRDDWRWRNGVYGKRKKKEEKDERENRKRNRERLYII